MPAFLLLCVALGGSSRPSWGNAALQVLAVLLIAFTTVSGQAGQRTSGSRVVIGLSVAALFVLLIQLLPLPPDVWSSLPGRESIVIGYRQLGVPLPWLPLSMTPYATLATSLSFLPPIAVLLASFRLRQDEVWLAGTIVMAALAGITLGALQIGGGGPGQSPWYLYEITNLGAVGFFANSNHMGSLLLVAFPFSAMLAARAFVRRRSNRFASPTFVLGAAGCLLIPVGVALNHSLAALALFAPVAFMSFLLFPGGTRYQRFVLPAVVLVLVATIAVYTSGGFRAELMGSDSSSFATRQDIWAHTLRLIGQTFPVGTGMGSFPSVYVLGEDPTNIGLTYINHAHNDYLEILLEGGLVGAILGAAFLAWWTVNAARLWWPQPGEDLQRAATIATAALLLHSLVDYPLRTAAMASIFAMCLAIMATGSAHSREWSRFRTARHLKIA